MERPGKLLYSFTSSQETVSTFVESLAGGIRSVVRYDDENRRDVDMDISMDGDYYGYGRDHTGSLTKQS